MSPVQELTTTDVNNQILEGGVVHLIDVRTPEEFREIHARPAINMPLDTLDPKNLAAVLGIDRLQPVYLICRSGGRSAKACQIFTEAGYQNVYNVSGGTMDWIEKGLPTVSSQQRS